MRKTERDSLSGIFALPPFPVVLVTVGQNIMTAAAFHIYSFKPPSVMVGIRPENLTFELISQKGEFGINILHKTNLVLCAFAVQFREEKEPNSKKQN